MNHIAHFLLAPQTGEGVIGTLLADFVRGPVAADLPPAVAAAVRLHRAIDGETDRLPATQALRGSFAPDVRRFAGIALDLYFDHCLARDWARYSPREFDAFVGGVHDELAAGIEAPYVPASMKRFAAAMREREWLRSYADFAGIEAALGRLNHTFLRRFQRTVDLLPMAGELRRLKPECDQAFAGVFAHLQAFAARDAQR